MNAQILYTWLGTRDWQACRGDNPRGNGPVADTVLHLAPRLTHVVLLADVDRKEEGEAYRSWLEGKAAAAGHRLEIIVRCHAKHDPTRFDWVYDVMRRTLAEVERSLKPRKRFYLVGPGTATMAVCTLLLSRLAGREGELWQADERNPAGCRPLELPFALRLIDAPDPASGRFERTPDAQAAALSDDIIARSASTRRTFDLARRAAASEWPVLILGPTGSGKEVLAREIHKARGRGEFVAINCGAIPETLLEAKLFGYKRGAFTGANADTPGIFEEAGEGSVFLDEVGELPLEAQTRLLRVLQERKVVRLGEHREREVACRIVAATHRNLLAMVAEGRFREDLYFRLAGIVLRLEALRDRPEDLEAAIDRFWAEITERNPGFPGRILSSEAKSRLLAHHWPGNLRELQTVLVRAAFLASHAVVEREDIEAALDVHAAPASAAPAVSPSAPLRPLKEALEDYRKALAAQAVRETGGNKSQAARLLGITPQHLARLLKGLQTAAHYVVIYLLLYPYVLYLYKIPHEVMR